MKFNPNYTLNNRLLQFLLQIEKHKEALNVLPMTGTLIASLRETARLMTTHYSTQIEGNSLSPTEVKAIAEDKAKGFPGRERDEEEVRNYFLALEYIEQQLQAQKPITETLIQTIHGWAYHGKSKPTPYRDGQNVIRDGSTGSIVYMPPEASDVIELMRALVEWINTQIQLQELPVPILGAIVHYQCATIHPYYDGNGRTARLLTTYLLHKLGYGMNGIYSLEEYYAKNLQGYYNALTIGKSHNYYGGRAEADITPFLDYFLEGMAIAFTSVRNKAEELGRTTSPTSMDIPQEKIRILSPQQRQVLSLFKRYREVSLQQLSEHLGIGSRSTYQLVKKWVDAEFLQIINPSKKARTYGLSEDWERLIG